jgi:ABC-type antimicrobial peptide transport system permease subunit
MIVSIFNALQLVTKRSKAHWRLLSSIVVGVVVAVAILASTPLYSNALNDLGLRHALAAQSAPMLDLDVYSSNNLIDKKEFDNNTNFIDQQVNSYVSNLIHQKETFMMTQNFTVMVAGNIIPTDSSRPQGYFQSYSNLEQYVRLVEGRFPKYVGEAASSEQITSQANNPTDSIDALLPEALVSPDLEVEGLISPNTADLIHAKIGDRLIFFIEGRGADPVNIYIRLVGLIEPVDLDDEFWFLRKDVFDVNSSNGVIVPLFVPQETIFSIVSPLCPKAKISYHWYYYVDPSRIDSTKAKSINRSIDTVESGITTQITNAAVFTGLNTTISEYLKKQLFTEIPLYLLVFQIAAIIFYYIATVASMVIEQQTGEIALLRSRGASTFQIFGIFLIEGLLISALGGVVGPFLGAFVFGLLGKTGPFIPLTSGGLLPIRFSPIVFIIAGVAAGLCLIAFMIPAIQASRRSILHHRQMIARPPSAPIWQRFYLDIVLLIAGGGLYYELQQRGSLLTQKLFGDMGVDPLMLITPLLFMLAVAIIFLRLFPLLVKAASKLSRYITSSVFTLTLRYMARNPIHYSRLILLLMMAASVGMFSASFLGTLNRSYIERVDYKTGSDVRLVNPQTYDYGKNAMVERYSNIDGVEEVSLVYRSTATVGTFTQTDGEILAVDPTTFGGVTWYRKDFSEQSVTDMMAILDKDKVVKSGILLPDGIEAIGLWIAPIYSSTSQLTTPSQLSTPSSTFTLIARIVDGRGIYSDITLGSLQYYDWQYIEGSLADSAGNLPVSPVRLLCIYVSGSGGMGSNLQGTYLDDLQVHGPSPSQPIIIEDFEDISEWSALSESLGGGNAQLGTSDSFIHQTSVVYNGSYSARYTWNNQRIFRGIYANYDTRPLSAIASRSFLNSVGISIGDSIIIRIPGQFVNVNIEGEVDYFPTLYPDRKPFLILNYDRLSSAGITSNNRLYPNEAWLSLSQDTQKRSQAIEVLQTPAFHSDTFYDRQALIEAQKSDPLVAAGWAGILLIAFVGVVLVSGLGFIVYAYLAARSRHLEFAVLRTLGFSWKQIISLVCLEQVFVIGLGMGIGTLLGSRLSRIMMPFLQLTEKGEVVIPPFAIVTDWSTIGIAYIILTVAFVITMSLVVLFFSRVALHRALRMGEE